MAFDYLHGIGVPRDTSKAERYLKRAASGGDFWAQSVLGSMYASGGFGPPDFAKSRLWLGLAASVGEKAAKTSLEIAVKTAPPEAWCQGKCVLDSVVADLKPCEDRARLRCVDSCEHQYNHPRAECENRYCNNMSDTRRYFDACFEEPSREQWQSCAVSCNPKSAPAVTNPTATTGRRVAADRIALQPDDFGRALAKIGASAREDFVSVRESARHRDPDDTVSFYRVNQSLPGMTNCTVMVDDDTSISPSFYCDQYRGPDIDEAARTYRALVLRVNSALAAMDVAACTESVRRDGTRVVRETTECRSKLPGRVEVRVRKVRSTFVSTGRTEYTTDLWFDAPRR